MSSSPDQVIFLEDEPSLVETAPQDPAETEQLLQLEEVPFAPAPAVAPGEPAVPVRHKAARAGGGVLLAALLTATVYLAFRAQGDGEVAESTALSAPAAESSTTSASTATSPEPTDAAADTSQTSSTSDASSSSLPTSAPALATSTTAEPASTTAEPATTSSTPSTNTASTRNPPTTRANIGGPLQLQNPGSATLRVGESVSVFLVATGGREGEVTFETQGLPPGLDVNPQTGEVTGRPTEDGVFSITATVSQQQQRFTQGFTWVVNP